MVHPRQTTTHPDSLLKATSGGNSEDWLEKASSLSHAFNKLMAKSACKMCNLYVDEQVEFENHQEDYTTSMAKAWVKAYKPSMEVELYRQMLFDEDSVVFSVSERDEEDDVSSNGGGTRLPTRFAAHHRTTNDDATINTQRS